jgi:hypothetical protein
MQKEMSSTISIISVVAMTSICVLCAVSEAKADSWFGTYVLMFGERDNSVTVDGRRVPSCGSDPREILLRDESELRIVYDGEVHVNGNAWSVLATRPHNVIIEHKTNKGLLFMIWFNPVDSQTATGAVFRWVVDKKGKRKCVDSRSLSGTYQK